MVEANEKKGWGGKRAGAGRRHAYNTEILDSEFDKRKACTLWCSPKELDILKAVLPFVRKYKELLAMESHEGGWKGTPEEFQAAYEKACILPTMPELERLVNESFAAKAAKRNEVCYAKKKKTNLLGK